MGRRTELPSAESAQPDDDAGTSNGSYNSFEEVSECVIEKDQGRPPSWLSEMKDGVSDWTTKWFTEMVLSGNCRTHRTTGVRSEPGQNKSLVSTSDRTVCSQIIIRQGLQAGQCVRCQLLCR